jgi:hypothetical protein
MSLGERGGTVHSVDEARELQEAHKAMWSQAIRLEILDVLRVQPEVHADDLLTLGIPADCKNIVGAQFNALVRSGRITETGERRKSAAPESHGRKSNVYRLQPDQERDRGLSAPSVPRGGSSGKGTSSPRHPAAATSGEGRQGTQSGGGGHSPAVTALPTLFELEPVRGRGHHESEAA